MDVDTKLPAFDVSTPQMVDRRPIKRAATPNEGALAHQENIWIKTDQ